MKINNKILISLLIVLIAAVSLSAVSATDEAESTDVATVSDDAISASQQVEAVQMSDIDMSGVISAPEEEEDNSTVYNVNNGANISAVEQTISNATDGDIISFAKDGIYDWHNTNGTNNAISVSKTLHFVGNNATIYCDNGFKVNDAGAGSTFTGFNFVMSQDVAWNGRGIEILNSHDVAVINCTFENGNAGVRTQGNTNITITGCSFYGATNASTIGKKDETGTKAVAIMGGSNHFIYDNYFGPGCLDGVSIASGGWEKSSF